MREPVLKAAIKKELDEAYAQKRLLLPWDKSEVPVSERVELERHWGQVGLTLVHNMVVAGRKAEKAKEAEQGDIPF